MPEDSHQTFALQHEGAKPQPSTSHFQFVLLCAAFFVEGADNALLPASFRALERDLGMTPSSVAMMGMFQAVAQSATAPFWGVLVDRGASGKRILIAASLVWGILTLCLAAADSVTLMVPLRMLNGFALAALTPVSQAMIASSTSAKERGTKFGWTGFAMQIGVASAVLLTTSIAQSTILGYHGWRIAFGVVSVASLLLALSLHVFMQDVRRLSTTESTLASELSSFASYFRIPTFSVIVAQGVFGSIPWSALAFMTMFLQYCGITDASVGLTMGCFFLSQAAGNVIGGYVADMLEAQLPYRGRVIAAQISVLFSIVTIMATLSAIPRNAGSQSQFLFMLVLFGLTATWTAAGTNLPALIEVVPPSGCAKVIALLTALQGSTMAIFGAPVVGFLSEHVFNYQPQQVDISSIPLSVRQHNLDALGKSMLWTTITPWILCFLFYCILHRFYRQDVELVGREHEQLVSKGAL
eukprot:TRINITY_DN74150_c0_g1_i1.p1 TRINITY_DN74150_c0_g1~~TRINITY_DN74150_c0_g1_i1.p1  ORF type:complete len:469 (+),score=65.98 TRINITY_DN74150_c0_g1_i1:150-1556(+)